MHDKDAKIGDFVTTLPADRLLASVGIPLLINSERLFNGCEDLTPHELVEISSELYIASAVLSAFCRQHEHRLKALEVELPGELAAVKVRNPLYEDKTTEPSANANGSISEGGDDFPF